MIQKSLISLLATIVLTTSFPAEAQQATKKIPRIGLHIGGGGNAKNPGRYFEVFRQSLHDLGYVEGKNLRIEYRFADGKGAVREAQLAEELVQQNLDAIVITTRPAIQAAMNASKTIPIVMVTSADPVAAGLVKSLARPGGNVTGVTRMTRELGGKRLELLKEMLPGLSRVGILMASDASTGEEDFKQFEAEARTLKLPVTRLVIRPDKPEIAATFDAAIKARTGALMAMSYGVVNRNAKRIAELGVKKRMPIMFERSEFVDGGGLTSYTADDADIYRRAAIITDKILKGTKPAELPVERPTKFELVINLKTAKQIGLTIPPNVLARADRVIK